MSCCILIAGLPASGKTTFAAHLSEQMALPMISKDRIKEILYDTLGFGGRAEKVSLSIAASELLYYYADSLMRSGGSFILENNFENVQKPGLQRLFAGYSYRTVTVRFGGDVQVIYQRYLARNTSPERHGGHKANDCWPAPAGDGMLRAPMSMDEFVSGVKSRGIAEFSLGGEEIYVDTTDFSRVSYEGLVEQVRMLAKL